MRAVPLVVLLAGCRGLFGFEDPVVLDDPGAPTVGFVAASTAADEVSGQVEVTVALSHESDALIAVDWAASGTATDDVDFTIATNPTLLFQPGETMKSIVVMIVDDGMEEDLEQLELELVAATGATLGRATHEVTIANDILPRVRFASATLAAGEATTAFLELVLDKPSPMGATVAVMIDPRSTADSTTDYTLTSEPIEFAPNATTTQVALVPMDDALDEEDLETVELVLVSASPNVVLGSITELTVELADNDDPPAVSFAMATSQFGEVAQTRTVEVRLAAPSARAITVPFAVGGTAAPGLDYTLQTSSPLSFPVGSTTRTISVAINGDAIVEPDETIVFTFGTATNATPVAPTSHTLIILDND